MARQASRVDTRTGAARTRSQARPGAGHLLTTIVAQIVFEVWGGTLPWWASLIRHAAGLCHEYVCDEVLEHGARVASLRVSWLIPAPTSSHRDPLDVPTHYNSVTKKFRRHRGPDTVGQVPTTKTPI